MFAEGEWGFSVLVVDENLSEAGGILTGSEGVQQLRQQGCRSKIIHCSGNCSDADRAKYIDRGSDMVWAKPFPRPAEMAEGLNGLLKVAQKAEEVRSVLLIEDDMVNTMVLKHTLESAPGLKALNLRVETLQTAEEMVALYERTHARDWNYALVILDENLSDAGGVMLGSEGLRRLRQQGCDTRFISCSCFCSPQDRKKYIDAGANAVWPKPYPQCADMAASIRSLLDLPGDSARDIDRLLIVEVRELVCCRYHTSFMPFLTAPSVEPGHIHRRTTT